MISTHTSSGPMTEIYPEDLKYQQMYKYIFTERGRFH